MNTTTLLPITRVVTYDLGHNNSDTTFSTFQTARRFIESCGTKVYNVYRIEKVNGTWRTDWVLVCD